MDDKIFKADAKQIVDMCFDNKLFNDSVTRDNMDGFEDLITYLLQSRFESYKRVDALMEQIEKSPKEKQS